jgi:hypothetical protein
MRNFIRRIGTCSVVLVLSASLVMTTFAQQGPSFSGLRPYDSFGQKFINPAKWSSQWQCGSPLIMECERDIQDGQLNLRVRGYGATVNDGGSQYGNSSIFLTSSLVTDIAVQVTVQETNAQVCTSMAGAGTHGQGLLTGAFFNGGGGTANDDVQAFLQFDRYSTDTPGVVQVGGFLQYQGQFFGNVSLGNVNVGEHVLVELKWDKAHHQFVERLFTPATNTWQVQYIPYTMSDSVPPVSPSKQLSARVFVDNCAGNQTFADMAINFDNIMTD